jgi:hypothetical protein
MSKTSLVLTAGLIAATFACGPAFAQSSAPGNASCKDSRLEQVVGGRVVSSEPVVACKEPKAVAFNVGPDRECAILRCKTSVLTGVGD